MNRKNISSGTFPAIVRSIPDEAARRRLVASLDFEVTVPEWALGYRWDIVVGGRHETPPEQD